MGKLMVLQKLTEEMSLMSDQERTILEKSVLSDWISMQLKAGKSIQEVISSVKKLGKDRKICFFTRSWAQMTLKSMQALE